MFLKSSPNPRMLMMLAASAALMVDHHEPLTEYRIVDKPREKPIPKGCKRYYFDAFGAMLLSKTKDCVFETDALTSKRARLKFNNFIEKQA